MNGFFITGTDTNVGKTTISAGIARVLTKKGHDVGIMKPFATANRLFSKDYKSKDTFELSNTITNHESDNLLNPVFYQVATAPYLASKILMQSEANIDEVISICNRLANIHEFMVIEGIGGIMVPLTREFYLIDFIKKLNMDTVIVANTRIGTINHIITTYRLCLYYKVNVVAILINKMPFRKNKIQKEIKTLIKELTQFDNVFEIPICTSKDKAKFDNALENLIEKLLIEKKVKNK